MGCNLSCVAGRLQTFGSVRFRPEAAEEEARASEERYHQLAEPLINAQRYQPPFFYVLIDLLRHPTGQLRVCCPAQECDLLKITVIAALPH